MSPRKHLVPSALALLFALLLSALPAVAAPPPAPPTLYVTGRAVTGLNRLLGQPINDWGPSSIGTFGYSSFGVYNPNGPLALPVNQGTPQNAVLASWVDPFWLNATGISESSIISLLNIPLRDTRVIVDVTGQDRRILPDHLSATQRQPSQAASNGPITLGKWLTASGFGSFKCGRRANSPTKVKLVMEGLIPHGLYTVWGIYGVGTSVAPSPLGGVPNVLVADANGEAFYERDINFCPQRLRPTEAPLLVLNVLLHPDFRLYGARPNLPVVGLFEGIVSQTHLEFVVTPPQ